MMKYRNNRLKMIETQEIVCSTKNLSSDMRYSTVEENERDTH